jgi:hypothetical protein
VFYGSRQEEHQCLCAFVTPPQLRDIAPKSQTVVVADYVLTDSPCEQETNCEVWKGVVQGLIFYKKWFKKVFGQSFDE